MQTNQSGNIIVSICCLTYNHIDYIRDTIEGFLMQETNFPVEIIIYDDASNDGTTEIVKEYSSKFPDTILPIIQNENQYSKINEAVTARYVYPIARGKYIAYCEGDDYWTDPLKLQKQVDFLEKNLDYILCTHNHSTQKVESGEIKNELKYDHSFTYDLDFYLGNHVTPALTACFRNIFRDYSYLAKENVFTDFFQFFELLKHGKGYFMSDNMAMFRNHKKGACSGLSEEQWIMNHVLMFEHLYKYNKWLPKLKHFIARYYLVHFNYSLRNLKSKLLPWNDLRGYFKNENHVSMLLINSIFRIPFYIIRYWLIDQLFSRRRINS